MKKLSNKLLYHSMVIIGIIAIISQPIKSHIIRPYLVGRQQEELLSLEHVDYIENESKLQVGEELFDYSQISYLDSDDIDIDIDKKSVVGEIRIPSVDIHLPIFIGTKNENLKVGVGTMKVDQKMGQGNYALAGHNSRSPDHLFAPIRHIAMGSEIIISNKETSYIYRAVEKKVISPYQVDVVDDVGDKKLLTLLSCYSPDGSDRIIVVGELVREEKVNL